MQQMDSDVGLFVRVVFSC